MHAGARRLWQTCGAKPGLQGLPRAALQEAPLRMRKGALWHAASFNEGPATSIGRTVAANGRLVAALRGEVLRMRFETRGAPDHKTAWLSGPFSKGKLSNTCALQHVFPVGQQKLLAPLLSCPGSSRLRHNAPQGEEKSWPLLPGRLRQLSFLSRPPKKKWGF